MMTSSLRRVTIVHTCSNPHMLELTVGEERILDKLDSIEAQSTQMLVGLARVEEQIKEVPDLRNRVTALEKWRWTALGALGAAGTSLSAQVISALQGKV